MTWSASARSCCVWPHRRPGVSSRPARSTCRSAGPRANVAAACARLGLRTSLISALPAEHAWGDRTVRELTGHGVDCAGVLRRPASRMGLYFLEYGAVPRQVRVPYDLRYAALSRPVPAEGGRDLVR